MSLSELPGYSEIKSRFGDCGFGDFTDLRCLNVDTYYEEDRERFEKIVTLVLKGAKGVIEVMFGNVRDFRISSIDQLVGFDVEMVRDRGWEQVRFEFFDYEHDRVHGLAENCRVSVSEVLT